MLLMKTAKVKCKHFIIISNYFICPNWSVAISRLPIHYFCSNNQLLRRNPTLVTNNYRILVIYIGHSRVGVGCRILLQHPVQYTLPLHLPGSNGLFGSNSSLCRSLHLTAKISEVRNVITVKLSPVIYYLFSTVCDI